MADKEIQHHKIQATLQIVDRVITLLGRMVQAVIWIVAILSLADIVEAIAGHATELSVEGQVDIFVKLFSELDLGCKAAWITAVLGIFYGYIQHRLRRRKTKYLADRVKELEKQIDSGRTGSGLTPSGDTPKGG